MIWAEPKLLWATRKDKQFREYDRIPKRELRFLINHAQYFETIGVVSSDRWGYIYNMTGHEARGRCFWCGNVVKNRRFCNDVCRGLWESSYVWAYASDACLKKAGFQCEQCHTKTMEHPMRHHPTKEEIEEELSYCQHSNYIRIMERLNKEYWREYQRGLKKYKGTLLEVHHIVPIAGGYRHVNRLNVPDNLICLCRDCHVKQHSKPKVAKPVSDVVDNQLAFL